MKVLIAVVICLMTVPTFAFANMGTSAAKSDEVFAVKVQLPNNEFVIEELTSDEFYSNYAQAVAVLVAHENGYQTHSMAVFCVRKIIEDGEIVDCGGSCSDCYLVIIIVPPENNGHL